MRAAAIRLELCDHNPNLCCYELKIGTPALENIHTNFGFPCAVQLISFIFYAYNSTCMLQNTDRQII